MDEKTTPLQLQLLEVIEQQAETINIQNETIAKLLNENVEKENFINSVIKEW